MPKMPDDLPENDRALVEAAREGHGWSPIEEHPTPDQLSNPTFVAKMPSVQARTIRALCLGLWDDVVVDPVGVRVSGARIDGQLNLSFCIGRGLLRLAYCHLKEQLVAQEARLSALSLVGSHLAKGLFGDGLRMEGDLICRNGFQSLGEVRLLGARIGGNADFVNASLNGGVGAALNADRMILTGGLFCRDGFRSIGEVRLLGAQIYGNVDFVDASLNGVTGRALSADRIVVKGSLMCRDGFRSIGTIRLIGAQIGGNLDFEGANLDGGAGIALDADSMVVSRGLFCRNGFHVTGHVDLVCTHVAALLDWRPTIWKGRLNLSHVIAGQWCDGWGPSGWSSDGESEIALNHFTYGAFFSGNNMNTKSVTRIAWIQAAQGENFTPGPYQTLARVLRAAGDDGGAAAVGLAKARARVKHQAKEYGWPRRWLHLLWMGVLDRAVGHGYRPWRGVGWLVFLLGLGTALFGHYAPTSYGGLGHIKPADPVFIAQNHLEKPGEYALTEEEGRALKRGHSFKYNLPVEYTPFNAFWYSFDTLIPLIDLGQEKAWSPSPLDASFKEDTAGWLLLFYLYFHIIMGWVLTTLTVVALTGLIKRDKEEE